MLPGCGSLVEMVAARRGRWLGGPVLRLHEDDLPSAAWTEGPAQGRAFHVWHDPGEDAYTAKDGELFALPH